MWCLCWLALWPSAGSCCSVVSRFPRPGWATYAEWCGRWVLDVLVCAAVPWLAGSKRWVRFWAPLCCKTCSEGCTHELVGLMTLTAQLSVCWASARLQEHQQIMGPLPTQSVLGHNAWTLCMEALHGMDCTASFV